jgi:hypothetical protein
MLISPASQKKPNRNWNVPQTYNVSTTPVLQLLQETVLTILANIPNDEMKVGRAESRRVSAFRGKPVKSPGFDSSQRNLRTQTSHLISDTCVHLARNKLGMNSVNKSQFGEK